MVILVILGYSTIILKAKKCIFTGIPFVDGVTSLLLGFLPPVAQWNEGCDSGAVADVREVTITNVRMREPLLTFVCILRFLILSSATSYILKELTSFILNWRRPVPIGERFFSTVLPKVFMYSTHRRSVSKFQVTALQLESIYRWRRYREDTKAASNKRRSGYRESRSN